MLCVYNREGRGGFRTEVTPAPVWSGPYGSSVPGGIACHLADVRPGRHTGLGRVWLPDWFFTKRRSLTG